MGGPLCYVKTLALSLSKGMLTGADSEGVTPR